MIVKEEINGSESTNKLIKIGSEQLVGKEWSTPKILWELNLVDDAKGGNNTNPDGIFNDLS